MRSSPLTGALVALGLWLLPASSPAAAVTETTAETTAETDLAAELAAALAADAVASAQASAGVANGPVPLRLQAGPALIDLAFIADLAAAWYSDADPRMIGGHDPAGTGFHLQQLEMALGAAVDPYFRLDGNLVFSLFGVEVEEIYATTLGLPAGLQVRAGQMLTRFGRLNATHPHSWDFGDQMLILGRMFGGEGFRGLGAELSWLLPLPWYAELVGSTHNADGGATMRSFYGNDDLGIRDPGDLVQVVALKQFWDLTDTLALLGGASAAVGPNGTGPTARTDIGGADLTLKWAPAGPSGRALRLQAEWLTRRRQTPGDLLRDHGGYVYALWQWNRRWQTALRYEYGSPIRNAGGQVVADDLDPDWLGERHRAAVAGTFRPSEFSRLRLQFNHDIMTWRPQPVSGVMLTAEFAVGAHAAHAW
jgi:hypothetical protein